MAHLPSSWSDALDVVASPIGIPQDQVRLIFSILAAIPLGLLHKQLPNPTIKHAFSFLVGLFIAWFVVGTGVLHVFVASVLVYFAAYSVPRRSMPYIVSASLVLYLSVSHLWRLHTSYLSWEADVSLVQMIFVVKASTFAFNVADGLAMNAGEQLHAKQPIQHFRAERALTVSPSLLAYLSYIWYFGGVLVGPCFECREYLEFTDLNLFRKYGLSGPPSTLLPALLRVGMALLCYPFVAVHGMYPIIGFVNTKAYAALPFWSRFVYFWVTMTCSRFKYYFAWYLSAAGCIASGLGLSKVHRPSTASGSAESTYEWNRCTNVDAVGVELATSLPQITNEWNTGVNNWLKNYVYFRVEPPASVTRYISTKSLANIVTKLTSAFWHGFYPAYYFFFLGAFVVSQMDDAMRARLRPLLTGETKEAALKATADHSSTSGAAVKDGRAGSGSRQRVMGIVYSCIAWFVIFFCMNQLGMAFMLLRADWSIGFWSNWYFVVFWAPVIVILFCQFVLPKAKSEGGKDGKSKRGVDGQVEKEAADSDKGTANGGGKKEL